MYSRDLPCAVLWYPRRGTDGGLLGGGGGGVAAAPGTTGGGVGGGVHSGVR